jgi:predicted Zn-dependent protease
MLEEVSKRFLHLIRGIDRWSLRVVDTHQEGLSVRQDVTQPPQNLGSTGAMVTITVDGASGYAATCDLSDRGLREAIATAQNWAKACKGHGSDTVNKTAGTTPHTAHYRSPVAQGWSTWSLKQKLELLRHACRSLHIAPQIIDWEATLAYKRQQVLFSSSEGAWIEQEFYFLYPGMRATANEGTRTQNRTHGSAELGCQGGLEQLERVGYTREAQRVSEQALQLLSAPNCPSARMDTLIAPAQMVLQIHETIGHPLELDRILGDERNYAGASFVSPEMVGSYRYGSDVLNVTFDPTESEELAAYGYDDEGSRGESLSIIENGVLMRTLGGTSSQQRCEVPGVASARASDWNRPPIDRIGNLNVEPGDQGFDDMVAAIEFGILLDTNRSWSIDDMRNKFQFGCEYGRMIRNGELAEVVRNPNYRGVSETFWRNLKMVGDETTYVISGTPYCGKGEPNQMIHVGHAAPSCLFGDVEVFGGA